MSAAGPLHRRRDFDDNSPINVIVTGQSLIMQIVHGPSLVGSMWQ